MKRIAFSLLSVVMLIVMALPIANTAVLAGEGSVANLTAGPENTTPLDYIIISPDNASIDGGGAETQAYSAEAFDAQGIVWAMLPRIQPSPYNPEPVEAGKDVHILQST